MRVCDRHPDRRARDSVVLEQDDARFDLCDECKTDVVSFLTAPVTNSATADKPRRASGKALEE